MLVFLLVVGYKQNITYYMLVFIIITISNMGYYSISSATSIETAVLGNRLTYLGGVFIPLLMFLCFLKLCKLKIPKLLLSFLFIYAIVVLYYAFSIEHRTDYYRSIELISNNGMSFLVKEYGPMHKLHTWYLTISFGCSLGVIFYCFFKKNNISYKVTVSLLVAELGTIIIYFGKNIFIENYELTVVAYIIDEVVILALIRRINMYEISENIAQALDKHSTYGYLVFDNHMRYVGCNDMALTYIPEIAKQKVDEPLSEENTPFLYRHFSECMSDPKVMKEDCEHLIERDDLFLKCAIKNLSYGRRQKKIGFLIELVDDTQQQKYMKLLNNYNTDLLEEVRKKTARINQLQDKMVLGMADMIENRDSNTGGHIKRTSKVIRIFTEKLTKYNAEYHLTRDFLENVAKAAPMHDLGKIAVDDSILRKPGKFTPEEFEEMKKHSEKGAEIIGQLLEDVEDEEFVQIAKNVAHYHHEKWNGEGYPKHLAGENIPMEARIMALADVFDALVSKRCYKEKMDYERAFSIIEESSGSHFDPKLTEIFLQCRESLVEFYNSEEE